MLNSPLAPSYTTLAIVALITLACFNMAFILRGGLPVEPDILLRMKHLTEYPVLWRLGWLNWMISALGLLLFCCFLLDYIPPSPWRRYAILVVALGVAPDLAAEAIYAFVLPGLAGVADSLLLFRTLEQIAVQLTGTVGNGAYNTGGLLLNILLLDNPKLPRALVCWGLPAWCLGLALSAASALQQMSAAAVFTAAAMVWNVGWMFAVALTVFRQPGKYRVRHEH